MDAFTGEIRAFPYMNFVPAGWQLCDGTLLPISSNTALFSLLGVAYGGDGRTTFAVPDLRGRLAVGVGSGADRTPRTYGESFGSDTVALVNQEMPSHQHASRTAAARTTSRPGPAVPAPGGAYGAAGTGRALQGTSVEGSGVAHENRAPALATSYAICLQGRFPSRP